MDYAVTATMLFTNEPLQKRVSVIYGRHIGELRKAMDASRGPATTAQNPLPRVWQAAAEPTGPITPGTITTVFTR